MARRPHAALLPTRDELLRFLAESGERPRTNEILRAFGLRNADRPALKRLMGDLEENGLLPPRRSGKRAMKRQELPRVGVVEVRRVDEDGVLHCRFQALPDIDVLVEPGALPRQAPGEGDRLLVRFEGRAGPASRHAVPMKLLPRLPREVVGVLEAGEDGMRLRPADRAAKLEYRIAPDELGDAVAGDMVRAAVSPPRPLSLPRARVLERLGRSDDPAAVSLSAAFQAGLPTSFSEAAIAEAEAAGPVQLGRRRDLRQLPLVTIDGEDARDFDDAVHAAADEDPGNPGGFVITVAIADVAHYVRPGTALDKEARERGNSVYFPDRVLPMLPEALSNGLCSLRPDEERACLAAVMRIDREGRLLKDFRFERGLMRSRARLTYTEVQKAHEGAAGNPGGGLAAELREAVVEPLFAAYAVLAEARRRRGTIELDLPERQVVFDGEGFPEGVVRRERLAAHMLIEEFMILANVAAATMLEERSQAGLFRIHDKPDPARLAVLADYLERIGVPWTRTGKKPGEFTELLERVRDSGLKEAIASFVLRSQAQAVYSPRNIGHFGLHLKRYAHFTSPIRRYSDLVVHRALIRTLGLGKDGLGEASLDDMLELGTQLSKAERRAMEAERAATERLIALHLARQVGAQLRGKVTSVQRFGLFVNLDESGADGLVPASSLGDDYFLHDERHHALVGSATGESFGLGDAVLVELVEADALTGSLLFRILEHQRAKGAELARSSWKRGGGKRGASRGRPPGRPGRRR
ncbi:ribonuclease R [Geminicoccaceae bacterium 1502E]|nr:ribonuclease R [Geminicoccaceae bacterium 1502E]